MTTPAEIAYKTAENSLAEQKQAIVDLRGRAATLLTIAALTATFFGTQALTASSNRPTTPPTTTTTTSATTTTPETATAITHGTTTEMNETGGTERNAGSATATTHGSATATTHGVSTTNTAPTSGGIHLTVYEWVALSTFVVLAILCIGVMDLFAFRWAGWHTDAMVIVSGYVDPGTSTESMQRDLALYAERSYQENQGKLVRLSFCLQIASVLLVVQILFWMIDLARG